MKATDITRSIFKVQQLIVEIEAKFKVLTKHRDNVALGVYDLSVPLAIEQLGSEELANQIRILNIALTLALKEYKDLQALLESML